MQAITLRLPKRKAHTSKLIYLDCVTTIPGNQDQVGIEIPDGVSTDVVLVDLDKNKRMIGQKTFTVGVVDLPVVEDGPIDDEFPETEDGPIVELESETETETETDPFDEVPEE